MSSNIISRNHVAQMLRSYKKEVSLGDVQAVSVEWTPPECPIDAILFSIFLFKAGYAFKKRFIYREILLFQPRNSMIGKSSFSTKFLPLNYFIDILAGLESSHQGSLLLCVT